METLLRRRGNGKRCKNDSTSVQEAANQTQSNPPMGDQFLSQPVNSLNLAIFRTAFGFLMCFLQYRALFWQNVIEIYYNYPEMNFHFCFARGIPKPPVEYIQSLFAISAVAAFCMGIGLMYRASCAIFLVVYTYLSLLEKSRYNNHFYLYILLTFFFLITDAHKKLSIDSILSRLRKTQETQLDTRVPYWQILIFRFQLIVVYFYAGIAKLNYDWFFRFEPLTTWSSSGKFSIFRNVARIFLPEELIRVYLGRFFSIGGLLFDLLIGFVLLCPTLRPLGLFLTVFFHLSNHFLFTIGTFPWVMMATNVLFLHHETISTTITNAYGKLKDIFSSAFFRHNSLQDKQHDTMSRTKACCNKLMDNLTLSSSKSSTSTFSKHNSLPEKQPCASPLRMSKLLKCFLMTYVVVQLLVPFRHWLYPGNVNWTLEGHQFSWRMMLNEEEIIMRIDVETNKRNYSFDVNSLRLVKRQVKRMLTDPEMVLQLVSHIKTTYVRDPDVAIKIDMWKSLNERPYQRYVNNTVDLTTVDQNAFSYDWIIPQMSDDIINFNKMKEIKKTMRQEGNDVRFFMESAGREQRVFMQPHFCDTVRLFALNSPIDFIVGVTKATIKPGNSVTVPSNAIHIIVSNSHATSIWYYVFDCHASLFFESLHYISDIGWKYTHIY